jgi:uncharacterized protein (TIGR00290 family)
MDTMRKAAVLWSGGKDSALALHHVCNNGSELQVVKLITCLSAQYDRVSMHGVRRRLIEDQAAALGLPVDFVVIPPQENAACPMTHMGPGTTFPPNDVYTNAMLAAFRRYKSEGIEAIVFGDIYLEDLRAFRDRLLESAGLTGCYPLWKRDPDELYSEFGRLGFQAMTVCVDTERLPAEHCGQFLTPAFRDSLPAGVDPCGERGEYHSFVFRISARRSPSPRTVCISGAVSISVM